MKLKLFFLMLCVTLVSIAQEPTDYTHKYEFTNTLNNDVGSNPLTTTSSSFSYSVDRFGNTNNALNPNTNTFESVVLNNVSNFSVSFWIKASPVTGNGEFLAVGENTGATTNGLYLSKNSNNQLVIDFIAGTSSVSAQYSGGLFDDTWHHILFTSQRTTFQHQNFLYVDGVRITNNYSVNGSVGLFVNDAFLTLSRDGNFNESLDDISIYPRTLSMNEASALYTATAPCTTFVNIPDANFKAALIDHGIGITGSGISIIDTDGDGEICTTEAQAYTGKITRGPLPFNDITGIEEFINITELTLVNNNLPTIDLSSNILLTDIDIYTCNTSLLNISQNIALESIRFGNNPLTNIDFSSNVNLLSVSGTFINNITAIDLSSNSQLIDVDLRISSYQTINIANGNNSNINFMLVSNNSSLNCIQHDVGFDPTTNANWTKDASATWSDNCANLSTEDFAFANAVKLYPNPTKDILNIEVSKSSISQVQVYSAQGKLLIQTEDLSFNVGQLNNGLYFLKLTGSNGQTATKKFIKQ